MSTWNRYNSYSTQKAEVVKDDTLPSRFSALLANPNISDGDKSFATSLQTGYDKYKSLTIRQNEAFMRMEQRYSANASVPSISDWRSSFDEEKRQILKTCAAYYIGTQYFVDLAKRVIEDPQWTPTEKQYRAMCENKYAQKLIANSKAEPRYKINDLITWREGKYSFLRSVIELAIIVKAYPCNDPSVGNRVYDVLPIGSDTIYKVKESEIKLARDKHIPEGD